MKIPRNRVTLFFVLCTTFTSTCSLSEHECQEQCGCNRPLHSCKESGLGVTGCDEPESSHSQLDVTTPTLILDGKHLKTGDSLPEFKTGKIRVYSMKFCPFSQRVRLVASYRNIPYEIVNINLKEKPDWLFDRNPKGAVPILELDGKVVVDSTIISDLLDELSPEKRLYPKNPFHTAQHKMLAENWSGNLSSFKSALTNKDPEHREATVKKILNTLQDMNSHLEEKFLGGESPSMVDFMVYPMAEKLFAATSGTLKEFQSVIDLSKFPKVKKWFKAIQETSVFKATSVPMEKITAYYDSVVQGHPQYDL